MADRTSNQADGEPPAPSVDEIARRGHAILLDALELDVAARRAFVESRTEGQPQLRAHALRLLASAEVPIDFLETPAWTPSDTALGSSPRAAAAIRPGAKLDGFTLIELAASGGMGDVYRAEQQSPKRLVALKIVRRAIRPADDGGHRRAQDRFAIETEALGRLQHPHVAHVHASGMTRLGDFDVPFVALEWVEGARTITQAAREDRLSRDTRVRLFLDVVAALQHAHGRGVIHRDLKPANVLVDQAGVVKVIDFGVALLTDRVHTATLAGEFVGTLGSMSPEQCSGGELDLDVRTDVYGLGTILYELLADRPPFDVSREPIGQAVRIVCETPPPSIPNLDRDLAAVVATTLAKDRTDRYASAEALGRDIRRWLDRMPIEARTPSTARRIALFVRRHRAPVAFAALAAVALFAGIAATGLALARALRAESDLTTQLGRTEEAQRGEKERADELMQVSDFQSQMLSRIDTAKAGATLMSDLKDRFEAALAKAGVSEPEIARRVDSLHDELLRVNATDAAAAMIDRELLQPAIATIDERFGSQPKVDAALRQALADLYRNIGLYDAARPLQMSAVETRRRVLGENHPDTLSSITNAGLLLQKQGKLDEAEPFCREALERCRSTLGPDHTDTLTALNNMGSLLQAQGKLAAAEPYYREALERRRRVLGNEHRDTCSSIANMGFLLVDQGKRAEAEAYYREALETRRRVLGEEHPDTLVSINNMGFLLQSEGRLAEAEPYWREALETFRRVRGEEHQDTLTSLSNMGFLLQAQGKREEAEPLLREALEKRRRVLGPEHPETLTSLHNMGFFYQSQSRFLDAEPFYRQALEGRRRLLGTEHRDTLMSVSNLGSVLRSLDRLDDAEPFYREALETSRRTLGETHTDTLIFAVKLGGLLRAQRKHQAAVDLLAATEPAVRGAFSGSNTTALTTLLLALGRSRVDLGFEPERFASAERNLLDAHAILAAARGPTHKDTLSCVRSLVELYTAWEAAEPGQGHAAKIETWSSLVK